MFVEDCKNRFGVLELPFEFFDYRLHGFVWFRFCVV